MMWRYLWICLIIYFNRIGYYNHYKNYALLSLNFDKNRRNSTLCDLDRRRRYVSEVIFFPQGIIFCDPRRIPTYFQQKFFFHSYGRTDRRREGKWNQDRVLLGLLLCAVAQVHRNAWKMNVIFCPPVRPSRCCIFMPTSITKSWRQGSQLDNKNGVGKACILDRNRP